MRRHFADRRVPLSLLLVLYHWFVREKIDIWKKGNVCFFFLTYEIFFFAKQNIFGNWLKSASVFFITFQISLGVKNLQRSIMVLRRNGQNLLAIQILNPNWLKGLKTDCEQTPRRIEVFILLQQSSLFSTVLSFSPFLFVQF